MDPKTRDDLTLAMAKAIWAADGRVNQHSGDWDDLERIYSAGLRDLFMLYAQGALVEVERQGWTLVRQ